MFQENLNVEDLHEQLEKTYQCGRGVILNHTEELMTLASAQPFVLSYPEHPLTTWHQRVCRTVVVWKITLLLNDFAFSCTIKDLALDRTVCFFSQRFSLYILWQILSAPARLE